jgi:glutamate--cysteine ligase
MARDASDSIPITARDELAGWFESGCKAPAAHRIGTEHEKFPFYRADLSPVPYAGARGIGALLEGMQARSGWEPIRDGANVIGLYDGTTGGAISLEPGGQFELSGAPLANLHETFDEIVQHLAEARAVADPLGIGFLGLGMSPSWSLAQTPVMPKSRYRIMANYMPKVGTRGLDMMFRTSTVQVNLDFESEADMVKKLRVSLALQPVATALFANSPFTEGYPNGTLSARSAIWLQTDPARTGMLPFVFEAGMGFERYVDYALDVPMYFVKRGETYHDVSGASFRDLLAGKLAALPGERATLSDWANHLSTIFPEVRLKRYLEMRGADCGSLPSLAALPALFVGLLYDSVALDGAWELIKDWRADERQALRDNVPKLALKARIGSRSVRAIATDMLALAKGGLTRRARTNPAGVNEAVYLAPLEAIVASGQTEAERLLARYYGEWGARVDPVFADQSL